MILTYRKHKNGLVWHSHKAYVSAFEAATQITAESQGRLKKLAYA